MKIYTIILSLFLLVTTYSASAEDFKHVETNWMIKKGNASFGYRHNFDLDVSHQIYRYDFAESPFRVEYRSVVKGTRQEDWFRIQMKQFKHNGFWYNHRIEHRIREDKDNVFRYRPQFGYKFSTTVLGGKPYITFEPQFQYTYDTKEKFFSHMQTFIGTKYKVTDKFTVGPFVEIDTDDSFKKELAFLGVDFKYVL